MKTLAEFIREKREEVGLTQGALAKKCNVKLEILEKIESSEELFLPVTVRQNLAKGLKITPAEIKVYEKVFVPDSVTINTDEVIRNKIMQGETEIACPKCNAPLVIKLEKMYDLQDNLVLEPKAYCSKCTFQIR